jgi:hypothetical protein
MPVLRTRESCMKRIPGVNAAIDYNDSIIRK